MTNRSYDWVDPKVNARAQPIGQIGDLSRLLNHPQHKVLHFCAASRCFKRKQENEKEVKVKGLVPLLKRTCWPDYVYTPSQYKTKSTGVRNAFEGMVRGDLVHRQIEMYVNHGWQKAEREFRELHPFTKKAIVAMREWKWTPIISELPVYDPVLNTATKADLICLDKDQQMVLVEWKCGMDNYIARGNTVMHGPFKSEFSNCPLNQAFVQLLFTKMFIEKGYGIFPRAAYVVQIHTDGIDPYTLPKRMETRKELCYQHVLSLRNKT